MHSIQALYDGKTFIPTRPVPIDEAYETIITFFEPMKVTLLPYDEDWAKQFEAVKRELHEILGDNVCEIHHVGSTAIKGIQAKPILDVAVIVKDFHRLDVVGMYKNGYSFHGERTPGRYLLVKHGRWGNLTIQHIHCFEKSEETPPLILFCNYLNKHPQYAREYNDLKSELTAAHPDDRWAYSSGKSAFVDKVLHLAENEYRID